MVFILAISPLTPLCETSTLKTSLDETFKRAADGGSVSRATNNLRSFDDCPYMRDYVIYHEYYWHHDAEKTIVNPRSAGSQEGLFSAEAKNEAVV